MIIFKFLFIVLLIIVLLVLILGSSFIKILSSLFSSKPSGQTQQYSSQKRTRSSSKENKTPTSDKKLIAPDEGEYVDFEEVKD